MRIHFTVLFLSTCAVFLCATHASLAKPKIVSHGCTQKQVDGDDPKLRACYQRQTDDVIKNRSYIHVVACMGGNRNCCKSNSQGLFDCEVIDSRHGPGDVVSPVAPPVSRRPDGVIRTGANLCLDVHAPEMGTNGGRVQVWVCNGQPQQLWTYDPASRAVRVTSGLCLDVHAPEITRHGGRVQIWACTGAPQQQWTPLPNGSLRNAGGFCLDVHAPDQTTNGGRVQVWPCNGSQQQRFTSRAFW